MRAKNVLTVAAIALAVVVLHGKYGQRIRIGQ